MRSAALLNRDFIALSQRLAGVYILAFALGALIFPFEFELVVGSYAGVVVGCLAVLFGSIALIADIYPRAAILVIGVTTTSLFKLNPFIFEAQWFYVYWLLAALFLIKSGVERRPVIEVGWYVGAISLSLLALGKIIRVGDMWWSGEVIRNLLAFSQPELFSNLSGRPAFEAGIVVASWFSVISHLTLFPLVIWKRARPWLLLEMLVFHFALLFTPLAFMQLGMIPFWIFLIEGTKTQGRSNVGEYSPTSSRSHH